MPGDEREEHDRCDKPRRFRCTFDKVPYTEPNTDGVDVRVVEVRKWPLWPMLYDGAMMDVTPSVIFRSEIS